VFAESALIVLSILLAFGIEAGWNQRNDRVSEAEALQGLRDDFAENVTRLAESRGEHTEIRDAAIRVLALTGPNAEGVPDLVMDSLVMTLIGGPKVFAVTATYDALIASGRIDLLQSSSLRRELATWSAALADLGEEEREAFAQMDQRLLPFLWDYVPIVTLDINVLPDYADVDVQPSRFSRRYRDLLQSRRFENHVEERMNSSIRSIARIAEVQEITQIVLGLVEDELR
jgi:hypothetical protein